MAGLNDGMTDDIQTPKEPLVDNENGPSFVKPPQSSNNAPSVTLVSTDEVTDPKDEHPPTAQDLFGSNPIMGEVPNIDAQLKLVEDGHSKTVDLKDIESTLLGKETVSQEDAQYLNQYCPNLLETHSIKEFSTLPSRTHHKTLLRYAREALLSSETEVMGLTDESFDLLHRGITEFHAYVEDKAMAYLKNQLKVIHKTYSESMEEALESSNMVVPAFREDNDDGNTYFLNVIKTPIYTFDHKITTPAIYKNGVYRSVRFFSGMCSLKPAIMAPEILYFVSPDAELNDEPFSMTAIMAFKSKMDDITLTDLFNFYLSETASDKLEKIEETLDSAVTTISNLKESWVTLRKEISGSGEEAGTKMQAFYSENKSQIQEVCNFFNYSREIVHHFMQMNNAMVDIMPFITMII